MHVLRTRLYIVLIVLAFYAPASFSLTITVLGDSLSAGYGMAEHEGWVGLLEARLQSTNKLPSITVTNASVSGATTAAGLEQLPSLLKNKPDIMIIALGGNDGLQGKPISYITKNLEALITQSLSHNAQVVLLGVKLPPNLGKRYTEPFFKQYEQLAHKHSLAYLPFMLEGVAGNEVLMQKDGIHPNAKAQKPILDLVWPVLRPVIDAVVVQ